MSDRFNIRVYGILFNAGKIFLSQEKYKNLELLKFPGGGLEYGEGTLEALRREMNEELGVDISEWTHFYTTDFFQKSVLNDQQIISIYYTSSVVLPELIYQTDTGTAAFYELSTELVDQISMPIDKVVMRKILELY